jgi:hypothetical protein
MAPSSLSCFPYLDQSAPQTTHHLMTMVPITSLVLQASTVLFPSGPLRPAMPRLHGEGHMVPGKVAHVHRACLGMLFQLNRMAIISS